jgi:DNA polymerase
MASAASQAAFAELLGALCTYVEYQRELGEPGFPPAPPAPPAPRSERVVRVEAPTADLFVTPGLRAAQSLGDVRTVLGDCRRCRLAGSRTQIVFGVGNPSARLVFVGEAPGRDEDLQGEPFVGRAGQLLTEIITRGMKLRREDVYIGNVIKCRPPENRNPEPDEVASCEPFLLRQLELIAPEVVVALGKFAAQTLLRSKTPITQMRGRWYDYHGIRLMPTFHPAYLLRNPADKRLVWEDIQKVMHVLGIGGAGA